MLRSGQHFLMIKGGLKQSFVVLNNQGNKLLITVRPILVDSLNDPPLYIKSHTDYSDHSPSILIATCRQMVKLQIVNYY